MKIASARLLRSDIHVEARRSQFLQENHARGVLIFDQQQTLLFRFGNGGNSHNFVAAAGRLFLFTHSFQCDAKRCRHNQATIGQSSEMPRQ
jgi:hypothetical protein